MKNEEIVRALRCISTAGGENACEHCPYWKEEEVPEEERPIYGADTWHSCDVDRVGLDGADLIERLTARCARYAEEIAVAQERLRWIPVTERLPEISNSGGYRMLSCASLAILPGTHRRIRDCVYIWRTEDGRATGRLCGLRIGCRYLQGRRWSDD